MQTKSLLSNERRLVIDELGFSAQDLKALDAASVEVAFLENTTRLEFISRLGEKH